jgi:hypothetical protein
MVMDARTALDHIHRARQQLRMQGVAPNVLKIRPDDLAAIRDAYGVAYGEGGTIWGLRIVESPELPPGHVLVKQEDAP